MLAIEFNLVVAGVPQDKNLSYPETDFSECFLTMQKSSILTLTTFSLPSGPAAV